MCWPVFFFEGLDMVKQKETIAELATKIQDCLKERSQRRQVSVWRMKEPMLNVNY